MQSVHLWSSFQINAAPAEGINTLKMPMPVNYHFCAVSDDLATEGRSNAHLYDKRQKNHGGDTKPDNVYTVAVNITNIKKTRYCYGNTAPIWCRHKN